MSAKTIISIVIITFLVATVYFLGFKDIGKVKQRDEYDNIIKTQSITPPKTNEPILDSLTENISEYKIGKVTYIRALINEKSITEKSIIDFYKFIKKEYNENKIYRILIDFGNGKGLYVYNNTFSLCKIEKNEDGLYKIGKSLGKSFVIIKDKVDWQNYK